jgi:hypothetical protein
MVSAAEYSSEQARGSGFNRYLRGVCSHKFQQRLGIFCFSDFFARRMTLAWLKVSLFCDSQPKDLICNFRAPSLRQFQRWKAMFSGIKTTAWTNVT